MNEYISLTELIQRNARDYADDVATRQKKFGIWQERTFSQLLETVLDLSAGLIALGMERGEHAGIISENCEEWTLSQFGANFIGVVPCGVYPSSPSNEVQYLLTAADCKLVFCEDQEQVDKVLEIQDQLPLLEHIVVFDTKGLKNYNVKNLHSLSEVIKKGQTKRVEQPNCVSDLTKHQDQNDTALVVFTSGSTGMSKAAMISFFNIWSQMKAISQTIPTTPGQNILSYLPLCHIAEQAVSNLNAVCNRVIINYGESLRTIRTDLQEIAPHLFFGVPRIWEKMQSEIIVLGNRSGRLRRWLINKAWAKTVKFGSQPKHQQSFSVRLERQFWYWLVYKHLLNYLGLGKCGIAMTAAAPISPNLLVQLRGMGLTLIEIFGMTETTGAATVQSLEMNDLGRIGKPAPSIECKLAEDGELLVKGGIIFKGYYKNEKATQSTIQEGWLHTGDIATAQEDGSFTIIDRKKDIMINAAGKNLSPSVIENTVKASPYIKECIVIADQRRYAVALIQVDYDAMAAWAENEKIAYTTFKSLSENDQVQVFVRELVDQANTKLASVEQIKKFHLLTKELDHDDGEVTATMKVKRARISEQYQEAIEALYDEDLATAS